MRILYISPTEPYPGTHAGYTHVHNLLRNLTQEGVEVTLIAGQPEKGTGRPAPEIPGLSVVHIRETCPSLRNIMVMNAILKQTRKRDFDLIHERYETAGGSGVLASRLLRIPHILEVNDPFLELNSPSWLRIPLVQLKRFQFCAADAIICQTPQIKRVIWSYVPDSRVFVIPNGADPSVFPLSEIPEVKRIGFMGSFMPWHGVRILIRTFRRVLEHEPDAELLLIGDPGNQRNSVETELSKHGIREKVRFTGAVAPDKVPGLLSGCRVLAAPFAPDLDRVRKEFYKKFGFWWSPLKIFEYMAAARPVVTPDLGMMTKYLGNAGLTYPQGDEEALVERVTNLLVDSDLAEKLGREGRKRVERLYNWRTIAHMTQMVYMSVCEKNLKGPR